MLPRDPGISCTAFSRWLKLFLPVKSCGSPVSWGAFILVVGGRSGEVCCLNFWHSLVDFLYANEYSQNTFCAHGFLSLHLAAGHDIV